MYIGRVNPSDCVWWQTSDKIRFKRLSARIFSVAGILLVFNFGAYSVAVADIYAYVDESGIRHFSNVPESGEYELLLKHGDSSSDNDPSRSIYHDSSHYSAIIESAARATEVDQALLNAVIVVESGFNERALSDRGAKGLMQLMPVVANHYGAENIYDPSENIHAGARYLEDLMKKYEQNLDLVLAAYNAGETAVDRYDRQIPPFSETQNYVRKVATLYNKLSNRSETP